MSRLLVPKLCYLCGLIKDLQIERVDELEDILEPLFDKCPNCQFDFRNQEEISLERLQEFHDKIKREILLERLLKRYVERYEYSESESESESDQDPIIVVQVEESDQESGIGEDEDDQDLE